MKVKYCLFLIIVLSGCTSIPQYENIEKISIEKSLENNFSFLDSIEIVPFETNDSVIIKSPQIFKYVPEKELYLVKDNQPYIFLFDKVGRHISNSSKVYGEGPHNYALASDVLYNPYSDLIEVYNPLDQGVLKCFDLNFNWVKDKKMNLGKDKIASSLSLLKDGLYAILPSIINEEHFHTEVSNLTKEPQLVKGEDNYLSNLNMGRFFFTHISDTCFYYTPHYLNLYFYKYSPEENSVRPIIKIDIADEEDIKKELNSNFGKANNKKSFNRLNNIRVIQDKEDYLLSSSYNLPIIRLISDKYVYVHFINKKEPYHLIYNRETHNSYYLTKQSPIPFYKCFQIVDRTLYALLYPYEIADYINENNMTYVTHESQIKLLTIKEDDNPLIIKYQLK